MAGIFAGARTSALGGGGRYGLFYSAVPRGAAIPVSCWLNGLQRNCGESTNLALVNTGDKDTNANVFSIDLYDGSTGLKVNSVSNVTLAARRWLQFRSILSQYAPGVAQAYARVTRTSGANSFLAYAVINDGGGPGQRSGDGAYLLAASAAIPGVNSIPVANAGIDQSALRNTRVNLDGSSSGDDDGDALVFRWTMQSAPSGSAINLSDAATSRPFFIPDLPGVYVLSLVVNDGKVDSSADTVSITVTTPPPTANAGTIKAFTKKQPSRWTVPVAAAPAEAF